MMAYNQWADEGDRQRSWDDTEKYPGQKYFHENNANIRASEDHVSDVEERKMEAERSLRDLVNDLRASQLAGAPRIVKIVREALDQVADRIEQVLPGEEKMPETAGPEALREAINKVADSSEQQLIDEFHRLWYSKGQFQMKIGGDEDSVCVQLEAKYCNFLVQKNPLDLWIYQEILWDCKPDIIIEMGTASGGTTLFLANQLDLIGNGGIISVDIDNRLGIVPQHPRILYLVGDSVSEKINGEIMQVLETEKALSAAPSSERKVMVILDDDHGTDHVFKELEMYGGLVTPGQYLIVEDTNVDEPLGFGDGPGKAVHEFLKSHAGSEFRVDRKREKFLMTWNPGGYLRRL